tara:strand:+ start:2293 stop:2541 length:249 start_codon:yes stop_codon:yes gene_type:complete
MDNERVKILKALTETNDSVFIALGNYGKDDLLELEFAVNANEDELFAVFTEMFKSEVIKDEARKAILFSDYGREDIDQINLN